MRGKQITDEEAIAITLRRYGSLTRGQGELAIKVLVDEFHRPKNAITLAIRVAFQKRLVEIRRVEREDLTLKSPTRNTALENELRARFPSLAGAIVVESSESNSDRIHRDIGYALARELGIHIDDGAIVGLGSGRGPYYTVEGAKKLTPLSSRGVTLMSLTGDLYPQGHEKGLNAVLDADFHTALFSMSFSELMTLRKISSTIAHEDIESARKKTWLDRDEYRKHTPTVAIVGLGVLKEHHRFYQEVRRETGAASPSGQNVLAPIKKFLKELVDISEKYSQGIYCPIADVCNRLMFVERPDVRIKEADRQKMLKLIEAINARLLTIDSDQLGRIRGLLLVAGTTQKALAIRKLLLESELQQSGLRIRTVCTDSAAAQLILEHSA